MIKRNIAFSLILFILLVGFVSSLSVSNDGLEGNGRFGLVGKMFEKMKGLFDKDVYLGPEFLSVPVGGKLVIDGAELDEIDFNDESPEGGDSISGLLKGILPETKNKDCCFICEYQTNPHDNIARVNEFKTRCLALSKIQGCFYNDIHGVKVNLTSVGVPIDIPDSCKESYYAYNGHSYKGLSDIFINRVTQICNSCTKVHGAIVACSTFGDSLSSRDKLNSLDLEIGELSIVAAQCMTTDKNFKGASCKINYGCNEIEYNSCSLLPHSCQYEVEKGQEIFCLDSNQKTVKRTCCYKGRSPEWSDPLECSPPPIHISVRTPKCNPIPEKYAISQGMTISEVMNIHNNDVKLSRELYTRPGSAYSVETVQICEGKECSIVSFDKHYPKNEIGQYTIKISKQGYVTAELGINSPLALRAGEHYYFVIQPKDPSSLPACPSKYK